MKMPIINHLILAHSRACMNIKIQVIHVLGTNLEIVEVHIERV